LLYIIVLVAVLVLAVYFHLIRCMLNVLYSSGAAVCTHVL